jgi:isopenicillin-N epimerase
VLVERPSSSPPSAGVLRDVFLLDKSWTFLNHGAFGSCPRPVFEVYQRLQLELEQQPIEFLDRTLAARVQAVRDRVAEYIMADPDGLVFVQNTTTGVNTLARSLPLSAGDEVLVTDHEYVPCRVALEVVCAAAGASVVEVTLPYPLADTTEIVGAIAAAAGPRTRALLVSHLASETAAILPVLEICRWARQHNVLSIVDGAHVPGQLPLDITAIDPDAYVGNCHKWLGAPKGSAFVWVSRDWRDQVQPLVISWGYVRGGAFVDRHGWRGTQDPAATLAVPAAITFQERHQWPAIRARGHEYAGRFGAIVAERYGQQPAYLPGGDLHAQMISVPIPWDEEPRDLQRRIRETYRIEVPVHGWQGRTLIRPSFAGYNDWSHAERLLFALSQLLPRH